MVKLPVLDAIVEVTLPRDPLAARVAAQYIVSAPPVKEHLGVKPVRRPQLWADHVAGSAGTAVRGSASWTAQVTAKVDALRGYWGESRRLRPHWLDDATLMAVLLDGRTPDGLPAIYGSVPGASALASEAAAAVIGHHLRACAPGCDACDLAAEGDWTSALHERGLTSDPLWDLLTALQRAHVVRQLRAPATPAPSASGPVTPADLRRMSDPGEQLF